MSQNYEKKDKKDKTTNNRGRSRYIEKNMNTSINTINEYDSTKNYQNVQTSAIVAKGVSVSNQLHSGRYPKSRDKSESTKKYEDYIDINYNNKNNEVANYNSNKSNLRSVYSNRSEKVNDSKMEDSRRHNYNSNDTKDLKDIDNGYKRNKIMSEERHSINNDSGLDTIENRQLITKYRESNKKKKKCYKTSENINYLNKKYSGNNQSDKKRVSNLNSKEKKYVNYHKATEDRLYSKSKENDHNYANIQRNNSYHAIHHRKNMSQKSIRHSMKQINDENLINYYEKEKIFWEARALDYQESNLELKAE